MNKITVRYFYSPICPEAFASQDRLSSLFSKLEDKIHFESFNVYEGDFNSPFSLHPNEIKLINSIIANETYPLLYGQLFIGGKEIKGFPPSKKMIIDILNEFEIAINPNDYNYNYVSPNRERIDCAINKFEIKKYSKNTLLDTCIICTKYNPFIEEKLYSKSSWSKYENIKQKFLLDSLNKGQLIGFISYYEGKPAGFIEAFPLKIAKRLGFPVSDDSLNGVMITCLSIPKEMSGYGVASRLIEILEEEARKKNYKLIEVLSFPDDHNWQPKSLYEKHNYVEVKQIGKLTIMKKGLK